MIGKTITAQGNASQGEGLNSLDQEALIPHAESGIMEVTVWNIQCRSLEASQGSVPEH